ncbi:IFT complex B protein, dyf-6 [Giardia lamblia P15]|uniref:IFT complex B protein, dyf-6 n=1 Tax=Giardia intestinalis (strain P15) TaxID=658858 RepID=E1EYD8_GIAIA|nr:IFT complex B protein, dyf-6 [Giardia lamblia P15]
MFKNRKTKKGKADEVLEYEGATSLESNPVEDYDDHEDSKDQDSPTAGRHDNPGAMSLREINNTGYNIPLPPEPEHVDPSIKKMKKGLAKMSEKELFNLFHAFQPVELSLETIYVPFLPDYTPSIGDVDPFIKVPRPDNKVEALGLVVLDDPCINQSDPTVLGLQLKDTTKAVNLDLEIDLGASGGDANNDLHVRKDVLKMVPSADDPVKQVINTKQNVNSWIQKIDELHDKIGRNAEYTYSLPIPDTIMNLWEPQFIELLEKVDLPTANIELSTEEYARLVCALLDIPVGESLIESLHMLLINYMDVQDNLKLAQHGIL